MDCQRQYKRSLPNLECNVACTLQTAWGALRDFTSFHRSPKPLKLDSVFVYLPGPNAEIIITRVCKEIRSSPMELSPATPNAVYYNARLLKSRDLLCVSYKPRGGR